MVKMIFPKLETYAMLIYASYALHPLQSRLCLILKSYLATLVVIQTVLKHIALWARLHEVYCLCNCLLYP
jgi:hypothetical protein